MRACDTRTSRKAQCPIARSLERVGEWWSILIIRDALHGLTRFDQFEQSLGIAPNMLTRRLSALVKAGLLERRRYSERPPRYEYILTERGRDFRSVIIAMHAWGNRHFTPEGASVLLLNARTGKPADPVIVDRNSRDPMAEYRVRRRGRTRCRRTHACEAGGERMGHHATTGALRSPSHGQTSD